MYIREGVADTRLSQTGMLAVAVPGFVRGLEALHQKKGSLPWKDLLAPAASLARNGFPVHRLMKAKIDATAERFNEEARRIYMPQGSSPGESEILVQTDLANTIDAIANEGSKAFYEGKIAKTMVEYIRANGGILTLKDLREYQPRWRDPVIGTYRGYQIVSMPPPSSGGIHLVQMLNILEAFDLKAWGYGSANAWHHIAEAMKFAYADRSRWLGDSDFVDVPMARLISKSYADTQRKRIQANSVVPWTDVGGIDILQQEGDNTSHFSVVDVHGNAVSSTQTINLLFGSAMVVPGTGVILNDEMDDFAAAPGVPNAFGLVGNEANAIVPKKRPLSSMTPTIVLRDKDKPKVFVVAGSPGGSRIINTTLQVILHVIDFAMDIDQAVDAPRIHQQWFPDILFFESFGMSPDTRNALKTKGHRLERRERIGNAQAILVDPATGIKKGAGDSRGIGQGAGH